MRIIKTYDFFTENESFEKFYKELKNKNLKKITKEEYTQLFWFIYDGTKFNNEKNKDNPLGHPSRSFSQEPIFINLSKIFFDDFISLIIESIQKSLDESNNQEIANLQQMCEVFFPFPWTQIVDGFDKKPVDRLIKYFIKLDFDIYKSLNSMTFINPYIFKLLFLDDLKHYKFIRDLMNCDEKRSVYLKEFYKMKDYGKPEKEIIEDFFNIYDRLLGEQKIDFYKSFISLPKKNNEENFFKNITLENIEKLLVDYYKLFDGNTLYEDMNDDLVDKQPLTFVKNLWLYLSKEEYKSFLEDKLIVHENRKLSAKAKIVLDRLYNSLVREKKDYKNIFDNFENKNDRFFDYQQFKKDLIQISLLETENRKKICHESEDETNDRFRKDLHLKGYSVSDQSRGGESQSSRSVGERDLVIRDKESGVAESIIEAFQLKYDDKKVITEHYQKLIKKYDTVGNSDNFILVYAKVKDFESLWIKYQQHFPDFNIQNFTKDNLKIGMTKEKNITIHHLFINFYSEKPST